MTRRFWIALALGGVVGGGAVLGFGPAVRSQIRGKAERYGAEVEVEGVVPSWSGVRLSGVDVTVREVPGVTVHLDEVVVGWDKRPRSVTGGKIVAVGELPDLIAAADRWRKAHLGGTKSSGGAGGGQKLAVEGFEIDWSELGEDRARSMHLTGVDATRASGEVVLAAGQGDLRWGATKLSVKEGRLVLARGDAGYRVRELTTQALAIDRRMGEMELQIGGPKAGGEPAKDAPAAGSAKPEAAKPAQAPEGAIPANGEAEPHRRVAQARRAHRWLLELGQRAAALVEPDAHIGVNGATARLTFGDEVLNLGPGAFRVVRDAADIVLALEPRADDRETGKALTFSLRLPLGKDEAGKAAEERPVEGRVRGGPVWLSMLGLRDGDLGLRDVDGSAIEADLRVELPPSGEQMRLEGKGKVVDLSLDNKRLAPTPLEKMELAWRARLDYRLDGSRLDIHDAEIDVGAVRGLFRGHVAKNGEGHQVRLDFEMPPVECQRAFESIPKAMVKRLEGMRFAGSIAAKGHANFDTGMLNRDYDVDWSGGMSCRILDVPPALHVDRFRAPFEKLIYTGDKRETTATMGPDTPGWVPLSAISRFMVGAVLTTEDGRFFRHAGFDQEAIVNSIKENLVNRRFVRGASTISMQLAKNLYLPRTKTIARKLQEAILTIYLEQELTKDEMMELYLNVIEYAPDVYGIGPAAGHYFNTRAGRLSLGQSLYLASILSNPLKSYFGAGGAVIPSRMSYIHLLMKIVNKIGRISDEELERGLRETVVFGSSPLVAPPEDPYEESLEDDSGPTETAVVDPWAG